MTQLYSVEFYAAARATMNEGAVICQWLPYHLLQRDQALAITRAMAEVFPHVQVWEHRKTGLLVGSDAPLVLDAGRLRERLADPLVRADLEEAALTAPAAWLDGFLCDAVALAPDLATVEPVRDDRPTLEYAAIGHGLSLLTQEEEAAVREPFFRARLSAEPRLAGFAAPEAAAAVREWRVQSIARYGSFLLKQSGGARLEEFLGEQRRARPELAGHPALAELEERARRAPR